MRRLLLALVLFTALATACTPFEGTGFSGTKPDCFTKSYDSPGVLHVWTPGNLSVEVSCFDGESGTDMTHAISGGLCTFTIEDDGFYTINTFFSSASPQDYGAGCSSGEEFCVDGRHYKCFSSAGGSAMLEDGSCDACSIPCTAGEARCFGGSSYRCEGAPCLQWVQLSGGCGNNSEGGIIPPSNTWNQSSPGQNNGGTNNGTMANGTATNGTAGNGTGGSNGTGGGSRPDTHFEVKKLYNLNQQDKRIYPAGRADVLVELLNRKGNAIVKGVLSSPYPEVQVKGAYLIGELAPGLCYYEEIPPNKTQKDCWIQWPLLGPPLGIETKDAKRGTAYALDYQLTYVDVPPRDWWDPTPNTMKFLLGERKTETLKVNVNIASCDPGTDGCCDDSDCDEYTACEKATHKCVDRPCVKILDNGGTKDKLDFVFVGAGYSNYSTFEANVTGMMEKFFAVQPFDAEKDKFNLWIMLEPDYGAGLPNNCSKTLSSPSINSTGVHTIVSRCTDIPLSGKETTAESVAVLFNNTEFRSFAFGKIQWSSLAPTCQNVNNPERLILHESGHTIGGLVDEYVDKSLGSRSSGRPNCATNMTDATAWWGDLVGTEGVGYFTGVNITGATTLADGGCGYVPDYIRPTRSSIMKYHLDLQHDFYPVNERRLRERLGAYT